MSSGRIRPLWALLFFALSLALLNRLNQHQVSQDPRHQLPFPIIKSEMSALPSVSLFSQAFDKRQSGMLTLEGTIAYLFPGDAGEGVQKFKLDLAEGQSVIVLRKTEPGSLIESLAVGESIEVHGEYQWAEDGGVIQLSHQNTEHQLGWIKYKGHIYR